MAIDFSKIKFFVEGEADRVFLRDILQLKFNAKLNEAQFKELILSAGGYNGLERQKEEFKEIEAGRKREDGGINIVLFDADYSGRAKNHGFKEKQQFLINERARLGIEFEYFLFPNNAEDGTIETLLETCMMHSGIMQCWSGFENCVREKNKEYNVPANKTKVYAYLECLYGDTKEEKEKVKDRNRNFAEMDKWVFDEAKEGSFKEMYDFLNAHLSKFESE